MKFVLFTALLSWLTGVIPTAHANTCDSDRVTLQMLGTRGPEFLDSRASSSYLIWLDKKASLIFDAGPGSFQRFKQSSGNFDHVRAMFFSHLHVDHSADFSAYIKAANFTERASDLHVFGPSESEFPITIGLQAFVERSIGSEGLYPYLSRYLDPKSNAPYHIRPSTFQWTYEDLEIKEIYRDADFTVSTVSVHHGPIPALGYRVDVAGCRISFTGDMSGRLRAMPELAENSDILVAHNAIPEGATGVAQLLHMKPSYIGQMAQEAKVKRLLLTHLMKRSLDTEATLKEIRKSYQGDVVFPKDLDRFRP